MKFITTTSLLALALLSLESKLQAQEPTTDKPAKSTMGTPEQLQEKFMSLSEDQRKEFNSKLNEAQKLFSEKRLFDAIQIVDELDKAFPNHPGAMSLRAGCYVEMRAFDKALPIFEQVLEFSPDSTNIIFNIAELNFVMRNWETAHEQFTKLIELLPENAKGLKHLSEFKLLLCKLKMNQVEEAKAMTDLYDEWDDTPFYHYSRAALLYHDNKDEEAKKILREALFIWRDKGLLSSWQDTMIEIGYVRSFYGGDTDDHDSSDIISQPITSDELTAPPLSTDTPGTDTEAPLNPDATPIIPLDTE